MVENSISIDKSINESKTSAEIINSTLKQKDVIINLIIMTLIWAIYLQNFYMTTFLANTFE